MLSDIPAATAQLLQDPFGLVQEALNVTFDLGFQGVGGHFEIDVSFTAGGALSIPLLPPISPAGASVRPAENISDKRVMY